MCDTSESTEFRDVRSMQNYVIGEMKVLFEFYVKLRVYGLVGIERNEIQGHFRYLDKLIQLKKNEEMLSSIDRSSWSTKNEYVTKKKLMSCSKGDDCSQILPQNSLQVQIVQNW